MRVDALDRCRTPTVGRGISEKRHDSLDRPCTTSADMPEPDDGPGLLPGYFRAKSKTAVAAA
jgi:hypothetical protein